MSLNKPHISVAPMMDWTDRHFRYFLRLISPHAYLYTEMITTGALIHGDAQRFLRYDNSEHPIALQLGGSDPIDLATCAKMGEDSGYEEINLNCGCPSDRVQKGKIGVCLMQEPDHVAKCVDTMIKAANIPVTVKCRIGVDEQDNFKFLDDFIRPIADTGCETFIIHARKAWLHGLSPKENRDIPPLIYERVYELKDKYPHLNIVINGGITTVDAIKAHLKHTDGAMIGREAYQNPYIFAEIEREIFGHMNTPKRIEIAHAMIPYIERQQRDFDTPIKSVTRHMVNLFHGERGGKHWRRILSTLAHQENVTAHHLIETALEQIDKD